MWTVPGLLELCHAVADDTQVWQLKQIQFNEGLPGQVVRMGMAVNGSYRLRYLLSGFLAQQNC